MDTKRSTASCPCGACARLAGVTLIRFREDARVASSRREPVSITEYRARRDAAEAGARAGEAARTRA